MKRAINNHSVIERSPVDTLLALQIGLDAVGPSFSAEAVQAAQFEALKSTLAYMQKHSRHYAEALKGVDPQSIAQPADLALLPFTAAAQIVSDPAAFVCVAQRDIARIISLHTSGTHSQPKRLFFADSDLESCIHFFYWGMQTFTVKGDTVAIFLEGNIVGGTVDLLCRALEKMDARPVLCAFNSNTQNLNERQDLLTQDAYAAAQTAACFVGLPVQMLQMAKLYPNLRPKAVLLCADYVPQSVRWGITAIWHCEVFSHYGSTESALGGGVECGAHAGHHWRHADLLLEIIDPLTQEPLPHGEVGEIVFTTLNRKAMPLLRYRTGDLACVNAAPCPCGSPLPRLDKLGGRLSGRLQLAGGNYFSVHQLDEIIFGLPEIYDYTAKLQGANSLHIMLVLMKNSNAKGAISKLNGSLPKELSTQIDYVFYGDNRPGNEALSPKRKFL